MKIGDKIIFSLGREKGVIIDIRKSGMVEVAMEIGMNVVVNSNEIAIDYSTPDLHQKPINTNRFYLDKTKPKTLKKTSNAIDLHISASKKLNLEEGKILSSQLEMLSKAINQALVEGTKELIIIHGVGEGILKKAVHEWLKKHKLVKVIAEADNAKYGKGATKVVL